MTWTYSGDPADSDLNAVRYLVGDTSEVDAFVTDEEIEWALSLNANVIAAVADVAQNLAMYFATQAEQIKVGPLVETYQTRSKRYMELATRLERKASSKSTMNFVCGGVNSGTLREAIFSIGMHDLTED